MSDLFPSTSTRDDQEPRHKLFFAIRPPPDVAGRLFAFAEGLRDQHKLTGWPTPAARLHISLNGLGRFEAPPAGLVAAGREAAAALAWPSFVVALDRLGTWGRGAGKRPLVMWSDEGLIGVHRLHEALHGRLLRAGAARGPARDFNPHLTLLRDAQPVTARPVGPISWRVGELVLLDSLHGEGRHDVLGRWPLGAPETGGPSRDRRDSG